MNLSNLALKFNTLFTSGTLMHHASSMAANGDVVNTVDATSITSGLMDTFVSGLINIVLKVIYFVCAFVLNIIELFQLVVCEILGIGVDLEDYVVLDQNNPLIKMLTNDEVIAVFKIIFGVAIALIIIFTIFAIIRSEYKYATTGNEKTTSKGRIMVRSLRSFFTLGMFPLMLIFGIILVNALLAGFNSVLKGDNNVTLAGQIFAVSAYDGNNYRRYANQDIRVPILINFEDPIYLGQDSAYSTEELAKIYKNYGPKGAKLYTSLAELDFAGFNDSLVYRNNTLQNAATYNGFEKFVCTQEQYLVMADFIDYAVKHNLKYYIKAMNDVDVTWKYVSNTVYDQENKSLKITYKDASKLTNGKEYTVVYQPSSGDVSTPISDAIKTISALLSIGEYSDITFNALNRLQDSINIVEWCTDKAYLKLSSSYKTTPTATDKLLLYERARFKYNNSLNYTLSDLEEGVEVPVYRLDKRVFQGSTVSFVTYETHYVISINGTYYEVELNEELKDAAGNLILDSYNDHYYTLLKSDFDTFDRGYSTNDDAVDIYGDGSLYYVKREGAYKDIIITKSNGVFENELESGYIVNSEYDDQVSPVLKQISWSEKLIHDLQIIYKDININHLITTDKWLEQLGEYSSATDLEGEYISNISTALIHPMGLILAELFLGEIEESDEFNLYGSLMFDGKFDDETMKALMLSLLGEEEYFAVKAEFEYFNEIFNVFMGPVLDEIAFYENFELMNGQEASVQLYTYKAYLCSVLISSSAAEWLGQTALNLIGYTGLENEIVNNKGYYKKYSQLSSDYKKLILELYLENINMLKQQYVEEGDKAYPEYMTALKHYMGRYPINNGLLTEKLKEKYNITSKDVSTYFLQADEEQFDERLDRVLQSYLSDEFQLEKVNNAHSVLVTKYDKIYSYIEENYSADDATAIWEYISGEIFEARSDGNDDFTHATIEGQLNSLTEEIPFIKEKVKDFLNNNYDSYFSENKELQNEILYEYYGAIETFVEEKLDYIIPDQSHKYNGMMDDLESDMYWALMQSETIYVSLFNILTQDLTKDAADALASVGLSKSDLVDPKDNFFGLIKGDVEGANTVAGWEDLVKKVNNLKKVEDIKGHPIIKGMLKIYLSGLEKYIETQEIMDRLNRYYITYGVSAIMKQSADISLEVVLNSKHYTVGQNFTRAKFIEYVLGNQVRDLMNDDDFGLVFVDEDYEGLVKIESEAGKVKTCSSFVNMQNFLVELGDITATLSQMTNLVNVSASSIDECVIGATKTSENDLSGAILSRILEDECLPTDIVRAFFDVSDTVSDSNVQITARGIVHANINQKKFEKNNELLNTVLSYLLLTDESDEKPTYVDYSKLTLQELRTKCMEFLIDYEEQKGESTEQNQKRYLTVFALACGDWRESDGSGPVNNSWYIENREDITDFVIDKQSQATILRLAGLDNRPYEELVGAEYTIDFDTKGVDEANGDVFVICLFDEETKMYVPFMMTNNEQADGEGLPEVEGETWASKFKHWNPYTEYYRTEDNNKETAYFPVIAKGIIDHEGMPTAIRENEGNIEYYRDGIIIHDVGKYGLEEYFVSTDQIPVHHTGVSYVANMFSKLFTGKTLVEKLVESNPRFAANSELNFLYGKERTITEVTIDGYTAMSFNFDESACVDMEYLYSLEHMNIVVLIIAVASIVTALWKAVWGVTQRMFDITIYFLLGPAVISVIPLRQDKLDKKKNVEESNDDAYAKWKDTLIERLLSVFAYAIGFNIFFVIIPIVSKLTLFESSSMFAHLPLFNKLSVGFLNELARCLFIVAASYLTTRAPDLFAKITKTGNGFKDGANAIGNVKNVVNDIKDHWSGQYAMDKIGTAKDKFVSVIPGVALGKEIHGKAQKVTNWAAGKAAEVYLTAHGVPPAQAKKMSEALKKNMAQRQTENREYKELKKNERAAREAQRMGDDKAEKILKKVTSSSEKVSKNRAEHKKFVNNYDPGTYDNKGKRTR